MTKSTKAWLIAGVVLIITGCIIFGGVMMALKFDFKRLSTLKYETNEYTIAQSYSDIRIETDTADIVFVPTQEAETTVVCYEEAKAKHTVKVEDGTLVITNVDSKKWYDRIGINLDSPKITVNLPEGEYGDITVDATTGDTELPAEISFGNITISLTTGDVINRASASGLIKLHTTTGDISVEDISAGSLELKATTGKGGITGASVDGDVSVKVSTGKVRVTDLTCTSLTAEGTTGALTLENVVSRGKFYLKRSTGDVRLDGCDAAELFIKTTTGDVRGTLLTEKSFVTKSTTGEVDVPGGSGGKCEINVTTGDIKIDIVKSEE